MISLWLGLIQLFKKTVMNWFSVHWCDSRPRTCCSHLRAKLVNFPFILHLLHLLKRSLAAPSQSSSSSSCVPWALWMDTVNMLILACKLAANLWVADCRHLWKGHLSSLDVAPRNQCVNSLGAFCSSVSQSLFVKVQLCVWPQRLPRAETLRCNNKRLQELADDVINRQNKTTLHICPVVSARGHKGCELTHCAFRFLFAK